EGSMTFITPRGNEIRDCAFPTDGMGLPQPRGAFCCAEGRCFQEGLGARCD
ncbi:hypothetical protein N657DRAFT_556948, partial [Parathielavia appendiculata]